MMGKNVPAKKPGQRTVERWVTINGNHVPIFEGETEEDVKNRLNEWNKQNSKKASYHDYKDDKKKMTAQFMMNNPVMVDDAVVEALDYDVLADVYDTIEDIKGEYNCWVSNIKLMDRTDKDGNENTSMADININGTMRLNPEYFESEWYLDDTYKECVSDKFHPPAPNGAIGVISHELGHAIVYEKLFNRQKELLKGGTDWGFDGDIVSTNRWLQHPSEFPDLDTSGGKQVFKEWYEAINSVQESVASNKTIQEQWGGKSTPKRPNMSLTGMAKRFPRPYGVSGYAEKNYHELIAESFCDVYCNGNEASLISKEVYNALIKEMKK